MNKLNKKSIFAIIGLVLVLVISLVLPLGTAFADYNDLGNNALVDFNQAILDSYTNNYIVPTRTAIRLTNQNYFIEGHAYYLLYDFMNNADLYYYFVVRSSNADALSLVSSNKSENDSIIFIAQSNYSFLNIYSNSTDLTINRLILIDLTQMFGVNIPTLDECDNLFVANYYPYTTSDLMTFNFFKYNVDIDAILDFNQQFKFNPNGYISSDFVSVGDNNILVSDAISSNVQIAVNPFTFVSSHSYYIFVKGSEVTSDIVFANGGSTITTYTRDKIFVPTNDLVCNYLWLYNGFTSGTYYVHVVDLTQMFGDNVPTIDQCKSLFVAEYYQYTIGTPLSYDTLQAYNNGVNAYASSTQKTILTSNFINSVYAVNLDDEYVGYGVLDGVQWSVLEKTEDSVILSEGYGSDTISTICLPFLYNLKANTQITIEGQINDGSYHQVHQVGVGYWTNGGMVQMGYMTGYTGSNAYKSNTLTFTLPVDVDRIYIYCGLDGQTVKLRDFTVSYYVTDLQMLESISYNKGYKEAKAKFDAYYGVGGAGYSAIYNQGYYAYPTEDHFTFQKLIYSVIDVPVQAFTNLFDYDILGVNMKTFYLSLFTLAVIVTIIRLVL